MKKRLVSIFVIIAFLLIPMAPNPSADSLIDETIPTDEREQVGEVETEYNKYPKGHYRIDTHVEESGGFFDFSGKAANSFTAVVTFAVNVAWQLNLYVTHGVIFFLGEAFQVDFANSLADEIGVTIENYTGLDNTHGLYNYVLPMLLLIVGAWGVWVGIVKGSGPSFLRGIMTSIAILFFAVGYALIADDFLETVNDATTEVSTAMLNLSFNITNMNEYEEGEEHTVSSAGSDISQDEFQNEEGITSMKNLLFQIMIEKPYYLLQYGTPDVSDERADMVLSHEPGTDARDEEVEQEVNERDNSTMSTSELDARIIFATIMFIPNLILGLFVLYMAMLMYYYQFAFLFFALALPVALLLAIVPQLEMTGWKTAIRMFSAAAMKIVISMYLSAVFFLQMMAYNLTADMAFIMVILFQCLIVIVAFMIRRQLIDVVVNRLNLRRFSATETGRKFKNNYNRTKEQVGKGKEKASEYGNKVTNYMRGKNGSTQRDMKAGAQEYKKHKQRNRNNSNATNKPNTQQANKQKNQSSQNQEQPKERRTDNPSAQPTTNSTNDNIVYMKDRVEKRNKEVVNQPGNEATPLDPNKTESNPTPRKSQDSTPNRPVDRTERRNTDNEESSRIPHKNQNTTPRKPINRERARNNSDNDNPEK